MSLREDIENKLGEKLLEALEAEIVEPAILSAAIRWMAMTAKQVGPDDGYLQSIEAAMKSGGQLPDIDLSQVGRDE